MRIHKTFQWTTWSLIFILFLMTACNEVKKDTKETSDRSLEEAKELKSDTKNDFVDVKNFLRKKFTPKKLKKSELPEAVQASHQKNYPEVDELIEWESYPEVAWVVDDDSVEIYEITEPEFYVASFISDNVKHKAKYDKKGRLIERSKTVPKNQLPETITEAWSQGHYEGWDITEDQQEIRNGSSDKVIYRVVAQKGKEKEIFYFDKDGNLTKVMDMLW